MKLSTFSRIQVTVEIDGSSYGEDWTISDINKQANEEALSYLKNVLRDDQIKIIGTPKVLISTFSKD